VAGDGCAGRECVRGLEHQAYPYALTGLPNRAALHRRFVALAGDGRGGGGRVGMVVPDLISFRAVNEAAGHHIGDALLTRIGTRLAETRLGRRFEVFRLGGDEFGVLLPGAESEGSDVLHPLTYWVVEEAVRQLAAWSDTRPELTMAVNLSVAVLLDANCPQRLEEIIRRGGVEPRRVEFELTETAILADPASASTMLRRITASGARLAIDDFGTGYSSLTYLTRFPVDTIKIDRSFVSDMATGERSYAIVRGTVQLARSLGLDVVAEGIEDRATVEALCEVGCEHAQGYYFGAPAPADEIDRLLAERCSLPRLMGSGLVLVGLQLLLSGVMA
jgi:diguanylate cyclase (GGDEF)-like protein